MIDTLQQLRLIGHSAVRWISTELAGPDRAAATLLLGCMIALAVTAARAVVDRVIATRRRPPLYVGEPAMAEVLDDPIIRSLMARDGVARDSLNDLIAAAKNHFKGGSTSGGDSRA